jgi:chromosome partitioning protein
VPDTPGVARIIAIANQKGGVGKSTTAVSLGAALAEIGFRVLVIDLDPQGNASTGLGIKHEAREVSVYDVIVSEASVNDSIVKTQLDRLHAIPSTIDLAGAEIELVSQFSRETRLKKALSVVREGVYDFILLDCPPSLGLLTINALTAAEELLVPIQCEYYALEGVGQLLRNVSLVQQNINPGLRLSGIVMTMFDPRTKLSEQVVAEVQRYFGELVYDIIIPRTVRLSEAPGYGQPITVYDPKSKGAECYRELGREVALRPPPPEPMPSFDDLPEVVMPAVDAPTPAPASSPIDESELDEVPTVHNVMDEAPSADEVTEEAPTVTPAVETPPVLDEVDTDTVRSEATESVEEVIDDADAGQAQVDADDDEDDLWEDAETAGTSTSRVTTPASPAPPGHLPERRVVVIDEDVQGPAPAEPSRTQSAQAPSGPGQPAVADIGETLEDEDDSRKRRWRLFRKGGE